MKSRDTSDVLVRHLHTRTLAQFVRAMNNLNLRNPKRLDFEEVKQGLKEVVEAHGTDSLQYDSYLKGIQAFLGR